MPIFLAMMDALPWDEFLDSSTPTVPRASQSSSRLYAPSDDFRLLRFVPDYLRTSRFPSAPRSVVSSKTQTMLPTPVSEKDFRQALGHFVTGVTVITAERAPGLVHGMTANAFTSVSLHPPLVLVCVDHRARLLSLLRDKRNFGVSVLKEGQEAWSEYFAKGEYNADAEERMGIRYRWIRKGVPVVDGTLAQLAGTIVASHLSGDHTIFIAEVEAAEVHAGEPLLFFRGEYRQVSPPR
jgi:flavin reductase (DIM6/NTAB) family NADH-FMN oxidoreductase RutF